MILQSFGPKAFCPDLQAHLGINDAVNVNNFKLYEPEHLGKQLQIVHPQDPNLDFRPPSPEDTRDTALLRFTAWTCNDIGCQEAKLK